MSGSTTNTKYTSTNNLNDRATLLTTGVKMTTNLGTFGPYSPGQIASIRLRNVGVMTRLRVRVTATATVTTAVALPSPFGPYGIVSKVSLLDYNTTERVSCPGPFLYMLSSMRNGRPWMPVGQGMVDTAQTQLPTAIGANQLTANYEVPLAYDPMSDLRGAILAQTVVGEQFLRLTLNPTVQGDPFSPYMTGGGTVALSNIYVTVWQEYLQPQAANLPLLDLNTVYEFLGMFQSSDNITQGGTKYLDYPNVRSVLALYLAYINNGTVTVNGTDINSINVIANGNTNMREQDPLLVRENMRNALGGDLPAGLYYLNHRRQPIQTWIYSQVQAALGFANATGSPYVAYATESTYPLNTALPGVAAGG